MSINIFGIIYRLRRRYRGEPVLGIFTKGERSGCSQRCFFWSLDMTRK